jgi:hypothetical protein
MREACEISLSQHQPNLKSNSITIVNVIIEKIKADATNLLRTTTQGMSIRDAARGPVCAPARSIHLSISTAAISAAAHKAAIFFLDLASTFQCTLTSLTSRFTLAEYKRTQGYMSYIINSFAKLLKSHV